MASSQDGLRQALLGHESLSEDNPSTVELTSMVDLPQLRQRKARFQGIRYVPQPIRYFVPEHQPKPQEESTSETSTPPRLDIRLDAAFYFPWLFRLLGWLTLTTSKQRWFSPRNLFKIVPVGTILAYVIVNGLAGWVLISSDSDPSNVAHNIAIIGVNFITGFAMIALILCAPLFDVQGFLVEAYAHVHPSFAGPFFSHKTKVKFTVSLFLVLLSPCAVMLYFIATFVAGQNIIIDLQNYLALIFFWFVALPVMIRLLFSLTVEVVLLSRIIELNFDLLDKAEDNEGFEKCVNHFFVCHSRTVAILGQYSARKQWQFLLLSIFALPLVILSLVLAITTPLTIQSIIIVTVFISVVSVPSLLGSLFMFTKVRARFNAPSREFFKSRVMVVRGLHHFHEVRQYLETLPVDFQLFGIGMSLPALLALGGPLIISTLFTIIRLT